MNKSRTQLALENSNPIRIQVSKEIIKSKKNDGDTGLTDLQPSKLAKILFNHFIFCHDLLNNVVIYDLFKGNNQSTYKRYGLYLTPNQTLDVISSVDNTYNSREDKDLFRRLEYLVDSLDEPNNVGINNIPCMNGYFNFKTKHFYHFDKNHRFTSKLGTEYNPKATDVNGRVQHFIKNILPEPSKRKLFRQLCASCLLSHRNFKRIAIFVGKGSNGKTSICNLLSGMINGYDNSGHKIFNNVTNSTLNSFDDDKTILSIAGKTCNIGDELPTGGFGSNLSANAIGHLKTLTGSGAVYVRPLYKNNSIPIKYSGQIIQNTNQLPSFTDPSSLGVRLLVLNFTQTFNRKKAGFIGNDELNKFIQNRKNREYLLKWILTTPYFNTFDIPKQSIKSENKMLANSNSVTIFYQIFKKYNIKRIPLSYLFDIFKDWCSKHNFKHMGYSKFTQRLKTAVGNRYVFTNKRFIKACKNKVTKMIHELKDNNELHDNFNTNATFSSNISCLVMSKLTINKISYKHRFNHNYNELMNKFEQITGNAIDTKQSLTNVDRAITESINDSPLSVKQFCQNALIKLNKYDMSNFVNYINSILINNIKSPIKPKSKYDIADDDLPF